jgi:hypothetical protein
MVFDSVIRLWFRQCDKVMVVDSVIRLWLSTVSCTHFGGTLAYHSVRYSVLRKLGIYSLTSDTSVYGRIPRIWTPILRKS